MRPTFLEARMLVSGMGALLLAALAVNFVVPQFRDVYEGFGAQLPWLTAMFLKCRYAFFLLPLLPPALWWAMTRNADAKPDARRKSAVVVLLVALGLTLVMVPLTILALYLPIFDLASAAGSG